MSNRLVTVADDRYGRKQGQYGITQDRIAELFKDRSDFSHRPYTWELITKSRFYMENQILLDNADASRNGRAYKPFVILAELLDIHDGEFMVYNDCSPEIWENVTPEMLDSFAPDVAFDLCEKANGILGMFIKWDSKPIPDGEFGRATHRYYTTNRCMNKMGLSFYEDAFICASGMLVLKKTPRVMAIIDEWLKWCCVDECSAMGWANIPGDYSFWEEESNPEFDFPGSKLGHRGDQSILGLLLARFNWNFVQPPQNEMHPANFLQYCRKDHSYEFTPCLPPLKIGDRVKNVQGSEMTVHQIYNGQYGVGPIPGSQYLADRETLKSLEIQWTK